LTEIVDNKATFNQKVLPFWNVSMNAPTAATGNEVVDLVGVRRVLKMLKVMIVSGEQQLNVVALEDGNNLQKYTV
jgi:hypothetical protein